MCVLSERFVHKAVLLIRISFNADPDPAFFPHADLDPGFFDTLDRKKNC